MKTCKKADGRPSKAMPPPTTFVRATLPKTPPIRNIDVTPVNEAAPRATVLCDELDKLIAAFITHRAAVSELENKLCPVSFCPFVTDEQPIADNTSASPAVCRIRDIHDAIERETRRVLGITEACQL